MKRHTLVIGSLIVFLVAAALPALSLTVAPSAAQDDLKIWKEFVDLLKTDRLTADRVRPEFSLTPESQLAILRDFAKNAAWEEWETAPKIIRYGNLLTFAATLGKKIGSPWTYTFNFIIEDGRWYYRFLEGIFLPLDHIGPLPVAAATFPELPKDRMFWIQQEAYWSEQVRLFNFLTKKLGKEAAFKWMEEGVGNGVGYALAGSVWIPYYPKHRAFILYLCWEQAKLGGVNVTLEKLEDNEAVVRFEDHQYFALYMVATHLKDQIAFEDYIRIFELIWQARAKAAGWKLTINGEGRVFYFRFSR